MTTFEPGVYDIPAEVYHAQSSVLSSSGARKLLAPSCPALFRYEQDHGQGHKKAWDIGTAAHMIALGAGPDLVRIDADEWRTKAVKEEVAEVRAAGGVPLKPADYRTVHDMADALRRDPAAAALFNPLSGNPEQSLFWNDGPTGTPRRARLDWLPHRTSGRMIIPDYKTCAKADRDSIEKAIYDHGYHQQAAWYLDAALALGLASDAVFVFVFQEKRPPHIVTVAELNLVALDIGRYRNREAIDLYVRCTAENRWPGYADDVIYAGLPPWAENRALQEMS